MHYDMTVLGLHVHALHKREKNNIEVNFDSCVTPNTGNTTITSTFKHADHDLYLLLLSHNLA